LRIDGERVTGAPVPIRMGEIQETPVPSKYFEDRKLVLTWDIPNDEGQLNWRQRSRLAEVWLIRQDARR
ncbi:MAG: hypothetical protein ACKV22_40690, partial [Bryobacteraceae bacterium]